MKAVFTVLYRSQVYLSLFVVVLLNKCPIDLIVLSFLITVPVVISLYLIKFLQSCD